MKKLYTLLMACLICMSAFAAKGTLFVGYPINYDYVYAYDGFGGLDKDTKIGAGVLITHDMVKLYAGATIKGLRIGWADPENSAKATTFLRYELNGENVASGSGTLNNKNDGKWNTVSFTTPVPITEDMKDFYVGYECNLKAGSWGVSNMYPHGQAGSAFLSREGVNDEQGNLLWEDLSEQGTLSIQLIVEGETTEFGAMASLTNFRRSPVGVEGDLGDGLLSFKNEGMSTISSITLKYEMGEKVSEQTVKLTKTVAKGASGTVAVPVCNLGSGDHKVSISQVNGVDNKMVAPVSYYQLGVKANVAAKYTRRPLVEWIESENAWNSVKFYDDYLVPGIVDYRKQVSLLACHFEDQFMTGEDEELDMLFDLCEGDKLKVYVPTFMIDRSQMVNYSADNLCNYVPWAQGIVVPNYISPIYEAALAVPTFATLATTTTLNNEKDGGQIVVEGEIEDGVMTESDELGLVVMLLEDNVESDSQLVDQVKDDGKDDKKVAPRAVRRFGDEKEEGNVYGHVIHHNVCRYRLTPIYGDKLEAGSFKKTYEFFIEDEWKLKDMRVLAFLTMNPKKNGKWRGNVINSWEEAFGEVEGINSININPADATICRDLSGRIINNGSQAKGLIISGSQKIIR